MHTSQIAAIHGVVHDLRPDLFVHRNMLHLNTFEHHLINSPPYVALEVAVSGERRALTIDDATRAAATAALLARRHGHEVTLFVNPENIQHGVPYEFHILNAILDVVQAPINLDGFMLTEHSTADKRRFRRAVKSYLATLDSLEKRSAFVHRLAALAGCVGIQLPDHLQPITARELHELHDAGVQIANHGWSHHDHEALSQDAVLLNIERGREWIAAELGAEAESFAVPFGRALPPMTVPSGHVRYWFLLTTERFGDMSPNVVNRKTLRSEALA